MKNKKANPDAELQRAITRSVRKAEKDPDTPKKIMRIRYDAIMAQDAAEKAQARAHRRFEHNRYIG